MPVLKSVESTSFWRIYSEYTASPTNARVTGLKLRASASETVVKKSEISTLERMDEAIGKSESAILEKMDKAIEKSENSILDKVEKIVKRSETTISKKMDKKIIKSESLVLDEVERTRNILVSKIEKTQKDVDELKSIYRVIKMDTENTAMLLRMYDNLDNRVEKLEEKVWV